MVAANKLVELRILSKARQNLFTGKDSGVAQMAERDWYWWLESQSTEVEQFSRVKIIVARTEELQEQPLYTLVAFLSSDLRVEAVLEDAGEGAEDAGEGAGDAGEGAEDAG
jgi:general secretion pathway protein I